MRRPFTMPDAGEGLAEAEIVSWQVAVGDAVREDQELVTVETAKALIGIPCPVSGVLVERHGEEGETVAVGDLLAVFDDGAPGEPSAAPAAPTPAAPTPAAPEPPAPEPPALEPPAPVPASPLARPPASPAVRRRARELGIDLATVPGSGPAGRVLRSDLDAAQPAAAQPAAAQKTADRDTADRPADAATVETPLRGLRRTVARTMTAGWQGIPHMFDLREADATELVRARALLRDQAARAGDAELAQALTALPLLVKITAVALARHPDLHGFVDDDRQVLVHHRRCHLGIAVATPDGLVTPVLTDADRRPLDDLARRLRALTDAARARTLRPDQLSGPTFLVNNLGALGTRFGTPLIPPGLGGNVGFGRIAERPVVRDGQVVAAPVLPLSISADHRLVDGDALAAFAGTVAELVENPVLLLGGPS